MKDYEREADKIEPSNQTPLNRVVDAVHPESEVSRRFSVAVDQFLASSCKDAGKAAAACAAQLAQWAGNDAHLQPLAQQSSLVKEASQPPKHCRRRLNLPLGRWTELHRGSPSPRTWQTASCGAQRLRTAGAQIATDPSGACRVSKIDRGGELSAEPARTGNRKRPADTRRSRACSGVAVNLEETDHSVLKRRRLAEGC